MLLYPLHQNIKRWNSCVVLRNCRHTTGNMESKFPSGHFVFYRSKKYSKLSDLGSIVSDGQENMSFSCIYKGGSLYKWAKYALFSAAPLFYHEIYEKSTFSLDTIGPKSLNFEYFYFGSKPVARLLYLLSGFPVVWRQLRTPDLTNGEAWNLTRVLSHNQSN